MSAHILNFYILILFDDVLLYELLQSESGMIGTQKQFPHFLTSGYYIYPLLYLFQSNVQDSINQIDHFYASNLHIQSIDIIMTYCQSQAFSPTSFVFTNSPDETNLSSLAYATQYIFLVLGLYIIYKMCKLCSKAFSYSNFHIHEAYKFYTLALISTIMILISRTIQLQFAEKINYSKQRSDDETPFRKNPYFQGWIIFNQIIGIISVYSVNLVYALTALTWLMIAKKCDFNSRDSKDRSQDGDEEERHLRDHKFYTRVRLLMLYFFIPLNMILSVVGELHYSEGWCLTSRILQAFTSLLVFILFLYSIINILMQRWGDDLTPLNIKIIWCYLIFALAARQAAFWILQVQDLAYPTRQSYVSIQGQSKIISNIFIFLYSIIVTTIPIFLLSYLADKQLETQKKQIDRSERIIYTSTII